MRQEQELHLQKKYFTRRDDGQISPVEIDDKSKEIKQKSSPFYAFNKENFKAKMILAREEPVANSILEFFISEMDGENAICISMATLEKLFNLKRNAISKHIKVLTNRKFIEIFKIGNMNAYAVNANVVWTKGDANLWKAKFKATMYLDFDEQSAAVKREYTKQITTKEGR
ncbi:hypothetical protein KW416_21740 [Vibrio fluvialis]|nr:hypothetical protein [Vibrio fluvialis]